MPPPNPSRSHTREEWWRWSDQRRTGSASVTDQPNAAAFYKTTLTFSYSDGPFFVNICLRYNHNYCIMPLFVTGY